jgi:hypothetical protein
MGLFSRFLFRARFLSAIVSKQLVATRHTAPSPPLRGRAGEGGSHGRGRSLWLPPSLTLPRCSDRGDGGRVFGDIVDTFDSESRRLSDAVPRGVSDGREIGVCDAGLGRRSQRSAVVPSVQRQPDDRLQVAGALARGWDDRASGAVASAADFAAAQRCGDGDGRAFGPRGASSLGRTQDRQAAEGSGAARSSGALDGHCDPEAAWGGTGRIRRRSVRLHPVRAGTTERVVADGFQGPCGLARRPASSADRARRSLALFGHTGGVRRRADRDSQTAAYHRVPSLWPARETDHRQWFALGRWTGQPVHTARRLADRAWHQDQPFAALSSADHGQGRTLPPQPQGRSVVRSSLRRYRRRPACFRAMAHRLQHATAARRAWACRAGQPLPTESARLCRDRRALRICTKRCGAPGPARRSRQLPWSHSKSRRPSAAKSSRSGQPRTMASSTSSSEPRRLQPSTSGLSTDAQKVSTMSPNTRPPSPRSEHPQGGREQRQLRCFTPARASASARHGRSASPAGCRGRD